MSERPDSEDAEEQLTPAIPEGAAEAEATAAPGDSAQSEHAGGARMPTRREIMAEKAEQSRRNKPYIIAAALILLAIAVIPGYAFVNEFVLPPRERAVRVEDVVYTRGDVVDFIRFHQRLSEETGQEFVVGTSLFDALQTMSENEMAFQGAPSLGVTVDEAEIDQEIRRLLGYGYITQEILTGEIAAQIDEVKFQFLNNVALSEAVYRDIVRKDLFRKKVRERLAEDVPLIQEQVHLFRIVMNSFNEDLRNRVDLRLKAGDSFSDLAKEFSVDGEVARNGGDEGWIPPGVIPELDQLLFGFDEEGNRNLPIRRASNIVRIPGEGSFGILYVDEYSPAREADPAPYELLKDAALTAWFEEFRDRVEIELVLNSSIAEWVNKQVRLSALLPTPTPSTTVPGQFTIDELGQVVPATAP